MPVHHAEGPPPLLSILDAILLHEGERVGEGPQQVRGGRYGNASEVVRAGLRRLEDDADERAAVLAGLRRAVEEGRASGPPRPAGEVFDRLERELAGLIDRAG